MSNEEIIELNKLIADFMGKTVYPIKGTPEYKNWKSQKKDYEWFELKYDSSWDWIMPVVEKIEKTELDYGTIGVEIINEECEIKHFGYPSIAYETSSKSKIEATYLAVIVFIKWYNENNKTPN